MTDSRTAHARLAGAAPRCSALRPRLRQLVVVARQPARRRNPERAGESARRATSPTTRPTSPTRRRAAASRVKVPEGWARAAPAARVTFTDKLNTIRIESAPAQAPLTAAARAAASCPSSRARSRASRPGTVTTVTRNAGTAVRITYLADGAAEPGDRQDAAPTPSSATSSSTTAASVVLTLAGPKGADNVDPWRIVTDSRAVVGDERACSRPTSLYRFFHAGDDETLALRASRSTVERRRGRRRHRPVGLGQVDAAGLPGRPRRARRRHGARRRRAALAPPRGGARARCAPARIGVLFQQANLVGHLSVDGQRRARPAARRRARPARLARGRARALRRSPQRAHARARASSPAASWRAPAWRSRWPTTRAVLLADEPTGELDEATAARVARPAARSAPRPAPRCSSSPTAPRSPRGADREIRLRDGRVAGVSADAARPLRAAPARTYGRGRRGHRRAAADRLRGRRRARASRSSGPSGSGKSTLLHLHGRARRADRRHASTWPALGDRDALRPGPGRRRLPGAEPAAAADRRSRTSRCRSSSAARRDARGARRARARRSSRLGPRRARRQAARGDLRRPGAARRGRPRARRRAAR